MGTLLAVRAKTLLHGILKGIDAIWIAVGLSGGLSPA